MATISAVMGPIGNSCELPYSTITSLAACRSAIRMVPEGDIADGPYYAGDLFESVKNEADWPKGCYIMEEDYSVFFNEHPIGAASGDARPICAENLEPLVAEQLLFVGDSDIDYWDDSLTLFDDRKAYNVGFSGYTCAQVLAEVSDWVDAFEPKTVVLVCGENDLAEGETVDDTFAILKDVLQAYLAAGAKVVFIGTKDEPGSASLYDQYSSYDEKIMEYVQQQAELAALSDPDSSPPFVMVDSNAGFKALGNPDTLYADDDLHLSTEGYALWSDWVVQAIVGEEQNCFIYRSGTCVAKLGTSVPSGPSPSTAPTEASIAARSVSHLSSIIVVVSSFVVMIIQFV